MQPLGMFILLFLFGGIAVAVQASFTAMLGERIGLIGNGLIVFGGGLLFALLLLLDIQEDRIVHEVCYLESFQPKPEWREKYFQVKREAREPGLPLVS